MAARSIKSMPEPERGYRHREHRSSKGRDPQYRAKRAKRARKRRKAEEWQSWNKQFVRKLAKEFNSTHKKIHI